MYQPRVLSAGKHHFAANTGKRYAMASQYASARAAICDRLRSQLSRYYRLENYDLFFAPTLHIARVVLSQLFLRQEQARNQTRYASHHPVSELSVLPAVPMMAGNIALIEHVDLAEGRVRALDACQSQGVIDASGSFASALHKTLIAGSHLFVAHLNRHAALSDDLVLIALRTTKFSTLVRSELRLIEQGLALGSAPQQALTMMESAEWKPFNIAMVDRFALETPLPVASLQQPGLPFALIDLPPALYNVTLPPEIRRLPGRLLIPASLRGSGSKHTNVTATLKKQLKALLLRSLNS